MDNVLDPVRTRYGKAVHVSWRRGGGNRQEIRKKVAGSNAYPLLTRKEVLGV